MKPIFEQVDREIIFKAIRPGESIARHVRWSNVVNEFLDWADRIEITIDRQTHDIVIKGIIDS